MNSNRTSSSKQLGRHPTSRNSEEPTRNMNKQRMKAAKSFHGSVAPSAVKRSSSSNAKDLSRSRSFHSNTPRGMPSLNRCCDIHPEILLNGEDDNCPKCAIRIMKLAAATLEQRVAELELEGKKKELEENVIRHRRKERKLVSSSMTEKIRRVNEKKPSDGEDEGQNHKDSIRDLLRWSSALENGSSQRPSKTQSKSAQSPKPQSGQTKIPSPSNSPRPFPQRQFCIGQVAQPSQIDESSSRAESLIEIARMREGDGAWVKRSHDVWTYAILKVRENGSDAALVFTVNERGCSKRFPVTKWAKFVKVVAKNEDDSKLEREEDQIDAMKSESKSQTGNNNKGTKNSGGKVNHPLSKSLNITSASKHLDVMNNESILTGNNSKGSKINGRTGSHGLAKNTSTSEQLDVAKNDSSRTGTSNKGAHNNGKRGDHRLVKSLNITLAPEQLYEMKNGSSLTGNGNRGTKSDRKRSGHGIGKSLHTTSASEQVDAIKSESSLTDDSKKGAKNKVTRGDHRLTKSLNIRSASETLNASAGTLPSEDSSSQRNTKDKRGNRPPMRHDISMYTFGSDKSLGTCTSESTDSCSVKNNKKDEAKKVNGHDVSMHTFGVQYQDEHEFEKSLDTLTSESPTENVLPFNDSLPCLQIVKYESASEDENSDRRVSSKSEEVKSSHQSSMASMTSISESPSCVDYDADAEKISTSVIAGTDKVKKHPKRSQSPPEELHSKPKMAPKRWGPMRRISMTELFAQSELDHAKKEMKAETIASTQRKKLCGLTSGQSIPKRSGRFQQDSFYSALKSIHRRSSVMMPPISSVAAGRD